ncbi:hypothetical protein ACLB2K_006330 [Fragaria x ananassa]
MLQTTVFLPNIILDESNYSAWLFRWEHFLESQNLDGFVDGSISCPPQFVLAPDGFTNVLSRDYLAWKIQDKNIVNMMGQTLSPIAILCAVGSKSAKEMKGSDDIETYLDKVKVARDALATVGVTVDDEDIVVTVLRGLPAEYPAIKTVIRAQFVSCSLGELKTLLKAAEIDIDSESLSFMPLNCYGGQECGISQMHNVMPNAIMPAQSSYIANPVQLQTMHQNPNCVSQVINVPSEVPSVPPSFASILSQSIVSNVPSGFFSQGVSHVMPFQSPQFLMPVSPMPYGLSAVNSYPTTDSSSFDMTGFYAGRGQSGFQNNNNGATEFSTKWVEAIPLRKTSGAAVCNFIREYIICRHGVPYKIVTDNGTPFVNREVSDMLKGYGIKHRKSTIYYPQGNGQAEATNKTLLRILSKMVFEYEKCCSTHLPNAQWAYCTSHRTTTGFSPYSLVYGSEAISPVELTVPTTKVLTVNDLEWDASSYFDWPLMDLEAADEQRQQAEENMKAYHEKVTQAYNRTIKERCFKEGDLVLKTADWVRKQVSGPSKFAPQWEGPFVIKESHNSGYYVLTSITIGALISPINGKWLKLYYC